MKYLISYKIKLNAEYTDSEKTMGSEDFKFLSFVNKQYPILNEIMSEIIEYDEYSLTEHLLNIFKHLIKNKYEEEFKDNFKKLNSDVTILGVTKLDE